jgi:GT2 family glycosyltransferase
MKDNSPLVSLILLNHNGYSILGDLFTQCIDSLFATDYPNFEFIFVDNNSSDKSLTFIQTYLLDKKKSINIKIVECKQNIIANGYNKGIKLSKGKYVALLSNDMVYHPNWLKSIIFEMENDPKIGVAGCKRLIYGTRNTIDGLGGNLSVDGRANTPGRFEIDNNQFQKIIPTDWVGGAAVVSRDALNVSGLFDLDYKIFYEDTDLCFRIRRNGYKVVCVSKAILWHKTTTTIDNVFSSSLSAFLGEKSRIRFALIHFNLMRLSSMFIIDFFSFYLVNSHWKIILINVYHDNFRNISYILKRRIQYGVPPHFAIEYPVLPSFINTRLKKLFKE